MNKLIVSVRAFAIAGMLSASIGTAAAECVIGEHFDFGGQTGTVQNGDLLKFFPKEQMGLTGEKQFKREFNDASWAGKVSSVDPKGGCMATLYGPWGHVQIRQTRAQLPEKLNDLATGVGCYCKS